MKLNILLKFDIDHEQFIKDDTECKTVDDVESIMRHYIAEQVGFIVSDDHYIRLLASAVLGDNLQIKATSKVVLKSDGGQNNQS